MSKKLLVFAVSLVVCALASVSAQAQCAGGSAPQTGLASVSCTGIAAWTGQAVAKDGFVTYNNCLYKANQAISANPSWCPGCAGVYLYGNGFGCPTAGCNYGAQGPCGGSATATPTATATTRATPTPTNATRATATATSPTRATATATPRTTATPTTPTRATATSTPRPTATFTPTSTTPVRATATATTGGGTTCAVKTMPSGKVLVGYWESWDGAANGVHPGYGWVPITDPSIHSAYNVINAAFPVILSDGTAKWENGMDAGTRVPSPAEMCQAKAQGRTILLSIGGATAGIDLNSSTVADRFVATIVPILKNNNFDGIDIDIETGLVTGASMTALSASQSNLIRIIDGVLAQMPSNFSLTMAPETAYVTGGQIAYGGPWGAYLPIIKKYKDNGRLNYLNMQYYNGSMYGCPATSFNAGTVQGFVEQTKCINNGMTIAGGNGTFSLPYAKQVPGLPAQLGAGGGYMAPGDVTSAVNQVRDIKGLMTWSINWDGSKGWTFANNARPLLFP